MGAESWWHVATVVALVLAFIEGVLLLGLTRAMLPLLTAHAGAESLGRGIPVGTKVPPVLLPVWGRDSEESVVRDHTENLVLFVRPSCSTCSELLSTVRPFFRQGDRRWEVTVVVAAPKEEAGRYLDGRLHPGVRSLYDAAGSAESAFATGRSYPFAFALTGDGTVRGRGFTPSWDAMVRLVTRDPVGSHNEASTDPAAVVGS